MSIALSINEIGWKKWIYRNNSFFMVVNVLTNDFNGKCDSSTSISFHAMHTRISEFPHRFACHVCVCTNTNVMRNMNESYIKFTCFRKRKQTSASNFKKNGRTQKHFHYELDSNRKIIHSVGESYTSSLKDLISQKWCHRIQ